MTEEEMLEGIKSGNHTPELVEALIEFTDDFDPYGVREAFGDISKKTNRAKLRKEVKYCLKNDPSVLIEELEEQILWRK